MLRRITLVFSLLFVLCAPALAEEETYSTLKRGNVAVNYYSDVTPTEASCAALAAGSVFGFNKIDGEFEMTTFRYESSIVVLFDIDTVKDFDLDWMAAKCLQFHATAFPSESLTVALHDLAEDKYVDVYKSDLTAAK